ncbi:DsbA family protein [Pontibacillus yanchengensis]|uniref:Thiol-disulfide oxidoreductase n=1 Tax=Pontibacillus yanchengensis Y32 TaxID=1385514 RepID=A0A0A2TB44_9BACI|nr:thioredoxin domain-containing protein [Pontibacillus yanchengensis]KGP72759.1 thiol-disulfide oxidoreductase [Pontibacillus yanchengensis Y32]
MAATKQKGSNAWIYWMIGIILAGAVLIVVLDRQLGGDEGGSSSGETDLSYENQPYMGEESAPVEIIEFGDYLCPHCKTFEQSLVPKIKEAFVDTGKAKFYFMNYPVIGQGSERAAQFAEAVYQELGKDTFWDFHKHLFEIQPEDASLVDYNKDFFKQALQDVVDDEASIDKVVTAYDDGMKDAVQTDKNMAQSLGVQSTPTTIVNGKVFEGESFADLEQRVEEAMNESE